MLARPLSVAYSVCLRAVGLLPLAMVGEGEQPQAEWLLYELCGMYLAVLPARRAAEGVAQLGGDAASTAFGPPPR